MPKVWQHQLGKELGLGSMRVSTEDERVDSGCDVGLDLDPELIRIADSGRASAAAPPETRFVDRILSYRRTVESRA